MKERNYINAIIELDDTGERVEIIFKVGKLDTEDDMYVDAYLDKEEDITQYINCIDPNLKVVEWWGNELVEKDPYFKVVEYWKGERSSQKLEKFDKVDFDDFMSGSGKYSLDM